MQSNTAEVFGTQLVINRSSNMASKDLEEKSTIDKVFEDLDQETEASKCESKHTTKVEKTDCKENLDCIEVLHKGDMDGINLELNSKQETDRKYDDSHSVTNLMLHIDIANKKKSIKTKDGIDLSDLLENDINDQPLVSKVDTPDPNNLLDSDPKPISETSIGANYQDPQLNNFQSTEKISESLFNCDNTKQDTDKILIVDLQTSNQDLFPTIANQLEAAFDLSKTSSHFPSSSLEFSDSKLSKTSDYAIDSPNNTFGYHINHLHSLDSDGNSFDGNRYAYDDGLMQPSHHHNADYASDNLNQDYQSGNFSDLSTMDSNDLLSKYKQMEAQQELLNCSLMSLSTHFAQVQLRLKQIINSPKHEQEALLKNLEKFTFIGIPEVNELCLYNYGSGEKSNPEETETVKANKSYIEDKLVFEKNKHKEMIGKLRAQLEALENYVYEFSNNDSAEIPTNQIIRQQQIIINELKDKLNLNLNLCEEDQLRDEVNKSIIAPIKVKEDLILQLKTQISDLEKFINFLQSTQCKCSSETGQVDMKNKTITIMKKISTILHIFAEHHSSNFKAPATVAAMKKSMKVNHYGDLRAQLEIAINHVMDTCRQPQDTELPIDSDYMSDTDDPIPANSKVALAVRKHLAPCLQRLLQHGLRPSHAAQTVSVVQYISCASTNRRGTQSFAHIWDLIAKYYELKDGPDFNCKPNRKLSESFNLEIGGHSGSLGVKQSLLATIGNILAVHHKYKKLNPDSYFKSFVCDGLNRKLLVEWLLLILNYKALVSEVYAPWSYVAATQFSDAAQSLRRLYEFHFSLTIVDVTIRNLQSIKDAF